MVDRPDLVGLLLAHLIVELVESVVAVVVAIGQAAALGVLVVEAEGVAHLVLIGGVEGHGGEVVERDRVRLVHLPVVGLELGGEVGGQIVVIAQQGEGGLGKVLVVQAPEEQLQVEEGRLWSAEGSLTVQ